MSESYKPPTGTGPSKKKKFLIPAIGAAAVLLLTAGAVVGVQGYNSGTIQRCAVATTAARSANEAMATSVDKAAKARAAAESAKGYDKADGAATLLTDVDTAKQDLAETTVGTECTSRDQAAALVSATDTVAANTATLDEAALKLSAHVTAFQEAETKRIASEKKAAADAAAAAQKKADDEAAAAKLTEEAATAATTAAAVAAQAPPAPQHVAPVSSGGGYVQAPARQAPAPYVPAQPTPAPAPAPAPGGGWHPPPAGQGGGGGCAVINGYKMCG